MTSRGVASKSSIQSLALSFLISIFVHFGLGPIGAVLRQSRLGASSPSAPLSRERITMIFSPFTDLTASVTLPTIRYLLVSRATSCFPEDTRSLKDNTNYPIFKSFDEWKPPFREVVPDEFFTTTFPKQKSDEESMLWEGAKESLGELSVTEAATTMDQRCAFTGEVCHLEGAHICFKADREWYKDKKVHRQLYDRNHYPRKDNSGVDDLRNIITLNVKPHAAWDAHQLAILPLISGTFVPYFLDSQNNDLAARCHCATIQLPERTDGYLIFIRLAKTIFHYLLPDAWDVPTHPSSRPTPKSSKRKRSDDGVEAGGDSEGEDEEEDRTAGGGWLADVAAACAEDGIDFPADLEACLPSLMKETRRLEMLRQQALLERRRVDIGP
ncbi:hypothetical protein GGX14DRAFT_655528 [Mycena pura]|uniref:HNH nuclease domain-containing protein n=1 Tax=Mycena pura TaxID=153505 RepID=A0AAD6V735_9AGAR|nr:hypothetical protein GGX14DRAFT_655528 [Mycena pura]